MVDDELNQDVPPQMGPDGQPMVPPQIGAPQMGVPAAPDPLMGRQPMKQFMRDLMKKYQKKYMDDEQDATEPNQVYPGYAADLARKMK